MKQQQLASGAIAYTRTSGDFGYEYTRIGFEDCKKCYKGEVSDQYDYHYKRQCPACEDRQEAWLDANARIDFQYTLKADHNPIKSVKVTKAGKIVISEDKRKTNSTTVTRTCFNTLTGKREQILVEGKDRYKYFKTIEEAQAWIAGQQGGSIKDFWAHSQVAY